MHSWMNGQIFVRATYWRDDGVIHNHKRRDAIHKTPKHFQRKKFDNQNVMNSSQSSSVTDENVQTSQYLKTYNTSAQQNKICSSNGNLSTKNRISVRDS